MSAITNEMTVAARRQRSNARRRNVARIWDSVATLSVWTVAGIVILVLGYIIYYTISQGLPYLHLSDFVSSDPSTGMAPLLFNTFYMLILSLVPMLIIGVSAAIYMVEYARQGALVSIVRYATETLSSIPSIVIGLLGFFLFVTDFGQGQRWGFSRLAGALALTILNLPWMLRTAEDALRAVPREFREASLAMGATRFQTIFRVILPAAIPGLVTGILIVSGRVIGETAALIYTAGTSGPITGWQTAAVVQQPGNTLAIQIYTLFAEFSGSNGHAGQVESALVLLILILVLNLSARFIGAGLSRYFSGR